MSSGKPLSLSEKYSKWDKLELSDDESDVHPNIDKDSWFRWKHEARVQREAQEKKEQEELEEKNKLAEARKAELQAKLKELQEGVDDEASKAEEEGLRAELAEVEEGLATRLARLEEMEKNRKLNVDNVGTVVKDYTFINQREAPPDVLPDSLDYIEDYEKSKSSSKEGAPTSSTGTAAIAGTASASGFKPAAASKPAASTTRSSTTTITTSSPSSSSSGKKGTKSNPHVGPHSELEAAENYNNFVLTHEKLLEGFSEVNSLEQSKEMLQEVGHILLAEHSHSYLLLSCLEDEMNGKHARMQNTARQSQLLSHIRDLAASLGRSPRDVVLPFFSRLDNPVHLKGFQEAVKDFITKVQERAVAKRKEMNEARARGEDVDGFAEVEVPEEERLGPGGLDPVKVFEGLPKEMQEAFESRDMGKLHAALAAMPIEQAKKHMKECEDSGLWVPQKSGGGGGGGDDGGDEEEEEEEG